jgi:hypothetical protein
MIGGGGLSSRARSMVRLCAAATPAAEGDGEADFGRRRFSIAWGRRA